MINIQQISNFFETLTNAKKILILNSKPDGDSIGASLALNQICKKLEKEVLSFSFFQIPEYLRFLVEKGDLVFETEPEPAKFKEFDLIIIVDSSSFDRTVNEKRIEIHPDTKVLFIDHHQTPKLTDILLQKVSEIIWVTDYQSESTCGMLIDFVKWYTLEKKVELLDEISASLLFAGIVSDTDYFGYSNVKKETFERAAYLMNYNFDLTPIIKQFRETLSLKAFKFIQRNLPKVIINEEKRYAYLVIRREDYTEGDNLASVSEAANYMNRALMRIIDCVDFSFIVRDVSDEKSSLAMRRHNNGNTIDLSEIASYFGGGGHTQSAGAVVMKKADKLEEEIVKYLDKIL